MNELPFIEFKGVKRKLACLPSKVSRFRYAMFSDKFGVLPREKWQEMDFGFTNVPVLDQGTHSSCLAFASASGCMFSRGLAGKKSVILSPNFIYAQINDGQDAGSAVPDAFTELQSIGTCTFAEIGKDQIFKTQIPQSAYETAKNYRVVNAYYCPSFDSMMTAVTLGFPVVFGIKIARNFTNVDDNGFIPPFPDVYIGGHGMVGFGMTKSSKYGWGLKVRNSWNTSFGQDGNCFIPEYYFKQQFDAFAIKGMNTAPDELPVATLVGSDKKVEK